MAGLAAGGRALFGLDSGKPVPVVQIALLRSLPSFAPLGDVFSSLRALKHLR
jgi:hypothetical protein